MSATGQSVGGYRIVRKAALGAMSQVYEGRSVSGEPVAVKILHEMWCSDAELTGRFLNEARTLKEIEHSHIVGCLDYGRLSNGLPFMVLEWLPINLAHVIAQSNGALAAGVAVRIAAQLAGALAALHSQGVVHRDLKPANVLLSRDDPAAAHVKLADLGLAKLLPEEGVKFAEVRISTGSSTVLGTWDYMAPEQWIKSKETGPKADVYALGVLLFQMLTGCLPFAADDQRELMVLHLFEQPPLHLLNDMDNDVRSPSVGRALQDWLGRMMSKKTSQRPAMREVEDWLTKLPRADGFTLPS